MASTAPGEAPERGETGAVEGPWTRAAVVLGALALLWVTAVAVLWLAARRHGDPAALRGAVRLVPDVVRLLRGLAADPRLPRGVRLWLLALLVYLVLPVDLVPDLVPVVGYADDVVAVLWVLRSVVRRAGPEVLDRHWPGTPEGLTTLRRLAGIPE